MEEQLAQANYNLSNAAEISTDTIQLISTNLISPEDATKIQKSLSDDDYVCTRESKCGFVNLCNKKIAAPSGSYYVFRDKWHIIMEQIYDCNEDATRFHMETSAEINDYCSFCTNYEDYDRDSKPVRYFKFWAPKMCVTHIKSCQTCLGTSEIRRAKCSAYVQKAYNISMHYPKDLILLLCAHSRERDNIFHADNLPRDVFKLILRFVFPPAFLTIK